jgi:BlaI family penicillinase repressor
MAKKQSIKLSVGEMRLMAVLWRLGPLKLSEVYAEQPGNVGYTTIQTQLNRLVDKGVATRSSTRPTRYEAVVEPDKATASMIELLVDTIGRGSIIPIVELLLRRSRLNKEEMRALKQVVNRAGAKPKATKAVVKKAKRKVG